jgi:hypothetical protein
MEKFPVRGYYHPEDAFATIAEWEAVANQFLELEKQGYDTRGGVIDNNHLLVKLINRWFGYQLYVETQRFDALTQKIVLDFIEDFVNHRVWTLRKEFERTFYNDATDSSYLEQVKIAFFYSRGALEPFVLLDETFTDAVYGTTDAIVTSLHWTSDQGLINLQDSIANGGLYAISTFTKQYRSFFRPESNVLVKLKGKLIAAFKSDVKSIVTDRGNRAANVFRFGFPGEESNLCLSTTLCSDSDKSTYLWNEIIVKPIEIISEKKVVKY